MILPFSNNCDKKLVPLLENFGKCITVPGADPEKKILGLRWSKKAKITLQTKAFGETFLSVFSNFLHFYI